MSNKQDQPGRLDDSGGDAEAPLQDQRPTAQVHSLPNRRAACIARLHEYADFWGVFYIEFCALRAAGEPMPSSLLSLVKDWESNKLWVDC